jgi:hypothetical protein
VTEAWLFQLAYGIDCILTSRLPLIGSGNYISKSVDKQRNVGRAYVLIYSSSVVLPCRTLAAFLATKWVSEKPSS